MARRQRATEDFSHSITDLMTSIAVIFVLLFLFFADRKQEELKQSRTTVDQLLEALEEQFGDLKIEVSPREGDPLTLEITLPERYQGDLTFKQNKHDLEPSAKEFVNSVVPKVLEIICSEKFFRKMDSVVVEGHSSTEGKERRNVELSALRATETLLYAIEIAAEAQNHSCLKDLAAASGRGPWHPKGSDEASRRVVFRLRAKSFEQRAGQEPIASDERKPIDATAKVQLAGGL